MAEFRFDIRPLFPQPIVKVTSSLLPHTFRGDRRQCLDATSKMSEIIDRLGHLSAVAQKLNKPVTTAQRLRMSDNQIIYLMADVNEGHNGSVIGLLKVGTKDLYLFDEAGQTHKVDHTPCILDFYIHESRQRAGLGKKLFEAMLVDEHWTPVKCSIDRPSEKLLGFMRKHYGLEKTIPQANNFVLYEGFFASEEKKSPGPHQQQQQHTNGMHITNSPNTQLFGAQYLGDDVDKKRMRQQLQPAVPQITQISPVGRYGAHHPTCSMGEIIHNNATSGKTGAESGSELVPYIGAKDETDTTDEVAEVTQEMQNLHANEKIDVVTHVTVTEDGAEAQAVDELPSKTDDKTSDSEVQIDEEVKVEIQLTQNDGRSKTPSIIGTETISIKKPAVFKLNKQHTGMKNMSFGVGMAVTPTAKMEFDQETPEEFGVVKLNRPVGKLTSPPPQDNTDAMSTVSSTEGYTEQGYHDMKFYHNKLW